MNLCGKLSVVRGKIVAPSVLSAFVRRVMDAKRLSAPAVEQQAHEAGFYLDRGYISKIRQGRSGHLTVPMLQGLAAGLGVDEDELFYLVRGLSDPAEPKGFRESHFWKLYDAYRRITDKVAKSTLERYIEELAGILDVFCGVRDGQVGADPPIRRAQ